MTDDLRQAVKLIRQKIQRAKAAQRLGDVARLTLELDLAEIASRDAEQLTETDA